jgi:hypothetical protein
MNKPNFIHVIVINDDGTTMSRFINTEHIMQVYEKNENVYIELTEFTTYKVSTQSIHVFMDKFK